MPTRIDLIDLLNSFRSNSIDQNVSIKSFMLSVESSDGRLLPSNPPLPKRPPDKVALESKTKKRNIKAIWLNRSDRNVSIGVF